MNYFWKTERTLIMTSSTDTSTPQVTVEEITELITEFEKYRERLTNETSQTQ